MDRPNKLDWKTYASYDARFEDGGNGPNGSDSTGTRFLPTTPVVLARSTTVREDAETLAASLDATARGYEFTPLTATRSRAATATTCPPTGSPSSLSTRTTLPRERS